jgi:pimeloyl-ACP methyl ester carboxylesterase
MPLTSIRRESRVVHGYRRAFLIAGRPLGTAPVLWLIHGIGDSSRTWEGVLPLLGTDHTIIAPDLLGHGASDKPRADYSIGGFANGMRDLMAVLGVERSTVVGHSLGGGVAMQFTYQYPDLVERLVLVASGGLGTEVNPVLRAAALPGASYAIGLSAHHQVRRAVIGAARTIAHTGLLDRNDVEDVAVIWEGLRDRSTRMAFLRTLRAVIDVRGQAVTSRDRLYLAERVPVLLVWGDRDPILPVAHAAHAAELLPTAKLAILRKTGHMPHRTNPEAFATAVRSFVAETAPVVFDPEEIRAMLRAGRQPSVTKSISRSTELRSGTSTSA